MKTILLPELTELTAGLDSLISQAKSTPQVQTLGFFDLAGSTAMKLSEGHAAGTQAALRFTMIASVIVEKLGGTVVKELGDGALCRFDDPMDACKAALNIQAAAYELDLPSSGGLTLGRVNHYQKSAGIEDILGDAVDRCARVQGLSYPGQVLIDDALYEVVKTHLKDLPGVKLGARFDVDAKGLGTIRVWEIYLTELGQVDKISTPFTIHAGGRLSVMEKVQFMRNAETEIIEIGTGLTSFAKYFTGQKPSEFRNHLRDLLKHGVSLKCYALDPTYEPGKAYLEEQGDDTYEQEAQRAKRMILSERKECLRMGLPGRLEYYQYQRVPEFHCLGVDVDDPLNGRLLLSPYLGGMSRAEYPVHQVSRLSHRELYDKYCAAIKVIRDSSTLVTS